MPTPVLPDAVGLTIAGLLSQPAVTAIVGNRIYDRIPSAPTYPLISVLVVSDDEAADAAIGSARVQVDCWGRGSSQSNAEEARHLALTIRSVTRDMRGSYSGSPSTTGVIVAAAPAPFISAFDPDTGRARFILDLFIETHS